MINMSVIHDLEKIQDTALLDKTPAMFIKDIMVDIIKYQDIITQMYMYPISDGAGLSELGKTRTIKHDKVITDINMLRRVCDRYSLPDPFYDEELNERHDYAVLAFDLLAALLKEN